MFILILVLVLLVVSAAVTQTFNPFFFKINKYKECVKYLVWNNDSPRTFDVSNCIRTGATGSGYVGTKKIRIVFIRHGQSVWNSVYSERNIGLPIRLVRALMLEVKYLFTKPFESQFIDTPLSAKGIKQANDLANYVRSAEGKLSCDATNSVVVCSNLRRTMQTAFIALSPRLSLTGEKILIDSSLQEASAFIDTQSFSTERGKIAPMMFSTIDSLQKLQNIFDPSLNEGNKGIDSNINARLDSFLFHIFTGTIIPVHMDQKRTKELKEVIVVGHSLLFRHFFRRFLPRNSLHISKRCVLDNCAVVAFDLIQNTSTGEVMIDENSINPLYKGFIKH